MPISNQYKDFMHRQFVITTCLALILGGVLSDNVNESPLYGAFIGSIIGGILAMAINFIPAERSKGHLIEV